MVGTGVIAIVAGFATASFPVEQLLVARGVNLSVLRAKESFHVDLLRAIARKKREKIWKYESHIHNPFVAINKTKNYVKRIFRERPF